jgi:pantoate--beta-alanine ligase
MAWRALVAQTEQSIEFDHIPISDGGTGVLEPAGSIEETRRSLAHARASGFRVGLVPTMGALHDGHLRLIEECKAVTDWVVVSIFVNPTQFGPGEDFARYPRPLEDDLDQCEDAEVSMVFVPDTAMMYPNGTPSTLVDVPGLTDTLEGASRPGHFLGVATVVLKLFNIIQPDLAVFGQKDYQQQLVIRRMVQDLHVPVEIRTCATVREPDGLALSSRNRYLSAEERRAATVIYKALEAARRCVIGGERQADRVRQILRETLESEPLLRIDYAAIADANTLAPLESLVPERRGIALVAGWVGATRLLDNMVITD